MGGAWERGKMGKIKKKQLVRGDVNWNRIN
jgi:hypothetical protein